MTSELQVPKHRVPVELLLADGRLLRVEIFLSELAKTHAGAERMSDVLDGSQAFFPVMAPGTDECHLISLANVVFMRGSQELELEGVELQTILTEHELVLALMGGQKIKGLVTYELPPDRSRLVDFLNAAPPFFPVLEAAQVVLVNKRFVTSALPVQH